MKKVLLLLINHKKKVFFVSMIILLATIINLILEVVVLGQSLFSSTEEVFGWALGFYSGVIGILFSLNNKKEYKLEFLLFENLKISSFFSYLLQYFFNNGSYISGNKYWFRKLLQWPLIFFGIGFYLRSVTTYTRSRNLNLSVLGSVLFSIYSFVIDIYIIIIIFQLIILLLSDKLIGVVPWYAADIMLWIYIFPLLPLTYLLFKDGKEKVAP